MLGEVEILQSTHVALGHQSDGQRRITNMVGRTLSNHSREFGAAAAEDEYASPCLDNSNSYTLLHWRVCTLPLISPILAVKLSVISQSSSANLKSSCEVNRYPSTRAVALESRVSCGTYEASSIAK
jgi:hypothetical protein